MSPQTAPDNVQRLLQTVANSNNYKSTLETKLRCTNINQDK